MSADNLIAEITPDNRLALEKACEQFNAGEFWACHETLEAWWLQADPPVKTFLQGLIQGAAGCHHVVNVNQKGATSLLKQSLDKLNGVSDFNTWQTWLNFAEILTDFKAVQAEVERLGPDKLQLFCPSKFPVWEIATK